ncbi:MAG: hypothetical protein D6796_01195 [Caldilineae bacterium]|nr:MAG: hypothetical protein D6796_01195 [Caldilineae bacterium]
MSDEVQSSKFQVPGSGLQASGSKETSELETLNSKLETLNLKLETLKTGSILRVDLNRPDARNAMNRQMVQELLDVFTVLHDDRSVRVVVLGATGPAFCAGGDIKEMQADVAAGREAQLRRVEVFDAMLQAVMRAPQAVIARVHGAAMGGGLGLLCAADIAIAAHEATLGLPEVRLGLLPAIISPYVVARVGEAKAREWLLRGMRLDGAAAAAAGLVHHACPAAELDAQVRAVVQDILQASPSAVAAGKALLLEVAGKTPAQTLEYRVDLLNRLRQSPEGREGAAAFLQKRKPAWVETMPD